MVSLHGAFQRIRSMFRFWLRSREPIVFDVTVEPYDVEELRSRVDAEPSNVRTRLWLATALHGVRRLQEACVEYQEAIRLLSPPQTSVPDEERLSLRAFTRFKAADVLEQLNRLPEAHVQWQGCVDDFRDALLARNESTLWLAENSYYVDAMAKLKAFDHDHQ